MSARLLLRVLAVGAAAALAWYAITTWLVSDETRIERALRAMVAGVNERKVTPVLERLTDDFVETTLDADRTRFSALILYATRQAVPVTAEIVDDTLDIAVEGERATVEVRFRVTVGTAGGASETRPADATIEFALVDDEWKAARSKHAWPDGRVRLR